MKKLIWLALCLLPAAAAADDLVIYRCTGSSDVPVVQRVPCAAGMTQTIVKLPGSAPRPTAPAPEPARPVPAPVATEPPTAPTAAAEPPHAGQERIISEAYVVEREGGDAILDSAMLPRPGDVPPAAADAPPKPPLPPIFQCMDAQGGQYLHEYEAAPGRCELLNVEGLGGATPVNAASCEVVRDRCSEVAEDQRCGSWQQRFRDARGRERFAAAENREAARAERERLQVVLAASSCAVPD